MFSKLPFKFAYSVEDEEGVAAAAADDDDNNNNNNNNNNSLLLLHFGTTLLSVGISKGKKQLCVTSVYTSAPSATQMPTDKSYSYENLPGYQPRHEVKRQTKRHFENHRFSASLP